MSTLAEAPSYSLRSAAVEDEEFLVDLCAAIHGDRIVALCSPEEQHAIAAFERHLQKQTIEAVFPSATTAIVVAGRTPIGQLIVDRGPLALTLIDISLLRPYRRRGIGSALVRSLCEEAERRRVPLQLRVSVDNREARQLYCRCGFTEGENDGMFIDMVWRPGARP